LTRKVKSHNAMHVIPESVFFPAFSGVFHATTATKTRWNQTSLIAGLQVPSSYVTVADVTPIRSVELQTPRRVARCEQALSSRLEHGELLRNSMYRASTPSHFAVTNLLLPPS
jgi:hypothetical protein